MRLASRGQLIAGTARRSADPRGGEQLRHRRWPGFRVPTEGCTNGGAAAPSGHAFTQPPPRRALRVQRLAASKHTVYQLRRGLLVVFKPRGHVARAHAHRHAQRLVLLRGTLVVQLDDWAVGAHCRERTLRRAGGSTACDPGANGYVAPHHLESGGPAPGACDETAVRRTRGRRMSSYLVTGATGFIGRYVMGALVARGGVYHVVVREASRHRLERLLGDLGAAAGRIHVLVGDVTQPDLGLARDQVAALRGGVGHFFHLAARCDWHTDEATARAVNVEGTRHAIDLARALEVKACFHFLSSTAVAGRYAGRFYEHMLEEGQPPDHPYAESRLRAEALVRAVRDLPVRIYRPGIVVGDGVAG